MTKTTNNTDTVSAEKYTLSRKLIRFFYKLMVGKDRSEDYNIIHGKFITQYKDGQKSRPACFDVCRDYAEMFGGKVIDNF